MSDPVTPLIHFYQPQGQTFEARILCHHPDQGLTTHVTEYGTQVNCRECLVLMGREVPDE